MWLMSSKYSDWPRVLEVTCSISGRDTKICDACEWPSRGTVPERVGGNGHSIGSTVSNVIVRSWLGSTATGSSNYAVLVVCSSSS